MSSIVQPADLYLSLRNQNTRLTAVERSDGSAPWIYVGTYPGDPLTTPDSPPFENGWGNAGGSEAPVSFKRFLNWVHIRGGFTGGADGTTVFTLPQAYWPLFREPLSLGQLADGSGGFAPYVDVDGSVVYVTSFTF